MCFDFLGVVSGGNRATCDLRVRGLAPHRLRILDERLQAGSLRLAVGRNAAEVGQRAMQIDQFDRSSASLTVGLVARHGDDERHAG